jgi:TatD DNase family protein
MRLVDSHAHLQSDAFNADAGEVVAAARAVGVERLLVPGWDAVSSEAALRLASEWGMDAAAGIHPHDSALATDADWETIVRLVADPRVVAVGETGLDFDRMHSPREAQLANVRRHLRLGAESGKPVILHCRSAVGERDAQDALIAELRAIPAPAILHSFSGPVDFAVAALELGAAVSFSGLAFRRGEEASAEVVRLVPRERLLVETDSPYLSPPGVPRNSSRPVVVAAGATPGAGPGFTGRRNAPEWVRITAAWVAEQRGETPDSIGEGLVAAYDATFRRRSPS